MYMFLSQSTSCSWGLDLVPVNNKLNCVYIYLQPSGPKDFLQFFSSIKKHKYDTFKQCSNMYNSARIGCSLGCPCDPVHRADLEADLLPDLA
jgi:hypothetical protein